jgi:hypothetical protein
MSHWFELCDMYLARLQWIDDGMIQLETMPTLTKRDKEEKQKVFDLTMKIINLNRNIEIELDAWTKPETP